MSEADTTKRDYRDTVFLPKTDFPMKAGLPQKEPGIAARWEAERLYEQLRDARRGRPKFMYHDGPPYANGDMHIGHALNHTIKDMVCRTQNLLGKDAPYVPGWDCHGLPIEWKVEEQYRKAKKNKDEVPLLEFRAECRAYAQHWVDVQRGQLKRLGVMADWDNPYLTMQPESEATIVAELLKFAESGQLYRGAKPVMWSPVEKTALAEAEVEYEDIISTQIDVAFEITQSPIPELVGAHAVIWTTTPWTIPVNQALAYGPDIEYVLLSVTADTVGVGAKGDRRVNEVLAAAGLPFHTNASSKFLVAKELATAFADRLNKAAKALDYGEVGPPSLQEYIDPWVERDASIAGSKLAGTIARHPMHHLGGFFAEPRPFLPGDFVTTDSGTGLVHMAPDHGEDDFDLCKAHGLNPKFAVEGDGKYREDWGWLGGQGSVINPKFNAPDGPICADLREAGALLAASADYKHSYPHSWRSKAKVIYRCTPQWFVPMDKPLAHLPAISLAEQRWENEGGDDTIDEEATAGSPTLREIALAEIERVQFTPEKGRNRIGSMVSGRPDWVLSRQRAWGVPITLFVNRQTGDYLVDPEVNAAIVAAVRAEGMDAWTPDTAHRFLAGKYDAAEWEPVSDILDVWFDSGCSHAYVLEDKERWPDLSWPADIYVEGSDQHRGWFQSSLLESCATRGRAPYDRILTHGFTMDAKGMKMSKSLGNTIDPIKVMETFGADIIRLWALSVDFTEDHRIGDEILKGVADQYRKLRNTFRYLLGALDGFDFDTEAVGYAEMPELERYVLARLAQLDATVRASIDTYDFNEYVRALIEFCNEDLSAFYFDIRKDRLYCDDPAGIERRATRTVLDVLFQALVRYAAPVLVFTAEEVWATRFPDRGSVHLLEMHPLPGEFANEALVARYAALLALRERVTEAVEPLRREKVVRSSLEAEVTVPADAVPEGFSDETLAELFITATVRRGDGDEVTVTRTQDHKCGRCWRLLPEVAEDGDLCARCADVIEGVLA
ncbi:Isoleucine--tRNA ligase [Tsuneonella dongtanensis]|uniref:Isoleucine--tRNA ligase n=1 Tax=Tsuneonella dongtanensis TaxID=692370 RepID=A0A1B2AAH2_9SPHN|nr:isoleucine--tRNA ligase [Tsuneonella dongtanensis]ANY19160.1 Isoleucine--tRNA ligase [Tsuneonella dongtanensis]